MSRAAFSAARTRVPDAPALAVGLNRALWVSVDGEIETLSHDEAARRAHRQDAPLVCHARATASRLGTMPFAAYDLLELFAFVRPARFCLPTVHGLASALLIPEPETLEQETTTLVSAAAALLAELNASPGEDGLAVAWAMAQGNWPWGAAVLSALGGGGGPSSEMIGDGLKVWNRLPEWQEQAPLPAPESWPVEPVEARAQLVRLLGDDSESRPQQAQYASDVAAAFAPRDRQGMPRVVVGEAGTGVGKTLGYIAPATLWATKNRGAVWLSTYTRNLQRQLDQELGRAYPDPRDKARRVVVRKGRENMFCLLNFDEAVTRLKPRGSGAAVALGLVARWAAATRDGDMVGGDFPGWLGDLLGSGLTVELTDTRGECIYAACRHYRKCFIERSIRKARRADMVVANHALVMVQAVLGRDDPNRATRYVFDEGHHLFDAADSAFAVHLSGREMSELRRWLRGAEDRRRSRGRGLRARTVDLVLADAAAVEALDDAMVAAGRLPGPGWRQRIAAEATLGHAETFLARVRQQVYARGRETGSAYGLEAEARPPVPGLLESAIGLEVDLANLGRPLAKVAEALNGMLDDEAGELDTPTRQRVERLIRGLERRARQPIAAWRDLLRSLDQPMPSRFVDWLAVDRIDGRETDVGLYRHWLDPMRPFMAAMAEVAHGMVITSATLRDGSGNEEADWAAAEARTGVRHLPSPPVLSAVASPFDYRRQTRVLVVTDVSRDDPDQVSAAYRELFFASDGGALGLFTAINRLRAVYRRIAEPLDAAGFHILAQHVDPLDTGTLIDIFRAEVDSCLLGTDAVRDGIDVPGRSLRLIVFDRVPWPRPTIIHRLRRDTFGGRAYDEMLTRLRLKQAFGRLIRRADDRGVFVILDRALPTRLTGAFPPDVAVERVGLKEAIAVTAAFVGCGGSDRLVP